MAHVKIAEEIAHWEVIESLYQEGIRKGAGSVNPGFCFSMDLRVDVKNLNDSMNSDGNSYSDGTSWNDLNIVTHARRIQEKMHHEGLINCGCSDGYAVTPLDMAKYRKFMADGHIEVLEKLNYLRDVKSKSKTEYAEISV